MAISRCGSGWHPLVTPLCPFNKRGINGSEGNWLHQSIDDRVEEARQAIAWAQQQPMIDEKQIGVWEQAKRVGLFPSLPEGTARI